MRVPRRGSVSQKGTFKLWNSRNKGERPSQEPELHAYRPMMSRHDEQVNNAGADKGI